MSTKIMFWDIVSIFRPKRYYQNIIVIVGGILAIELLDLNPADYWKNILLAFVSVCLIASANYGINEILDADTDKHHPRKKNRAVASGRISKSTAFFLSVLLYLAGFFLVWQYQSKEVLAVFLAFFAAAILYNVEPFRFKDKPYLDFVFEAINSPLRVLMGWYAVSAKIFPASFILAVWFLGVFLMAAKRFGDARIMKDKTELDSYRKSQKYYTEKKLLFAMIGSLSIFYYMLGALCMKYSVDLILTLPFIIIWTIWFFNLAYEENTIINDPERIFEKGSFLLFSSTTFLIFAYLFLTKSHILNFLKD